MIFCTTVKQVNLGHFPFMLNIIIFFLSHRACLFLSKHDIIIFYINKYIKNIRKTNKKILRCNLTEIGQNEITIYYNTKLTKLKDV